MGCIYLQSAWRGTVLLYFTLLCIQLLTQLTLGCLKRFVILCTVFMLTAVPQQLFSQHSIPAGKVAPVPRSPYLRSSAVGFSTDSILAASDTAAAGRQVLPYTRQLGKQGYSSFVLAPLAAPVFSSGNNSR